jgi:hypothetical protein
MDKLKSVGHAVVLCTIIGGFSSSLHAVDYTFVEARFILDAEYEEDNFEDDGDGLRIAGSYQLTPEIFAFAKYDDVELDDSNIDLSLLRLGGGYIFPVNPTWDVNASLAYADIEADAGRRGDADESGFELSGGVRGLVKPQIEVRASLNYIDLEGSDTYFTFGGDYYFLPNVSAGIDIDMGGDYETMSIGAKYYF